MDRENSPVATDEIEVRFSVSRESELNPEIVLRVYNLGGEVLGELQPNKPTWVRLNKRNPTFRFGMPHITNSFRFTTLHSTAEMTWDGRRWSCDHAEPLAKRTTDETTKRTSPLVQTGAAGLLIGVMWAVVAFRMNVSVCGGFWSGTNLCTESDMVINLDLAQRRNLHFAGASLLTICSLMTTLFGVLQNKKGE
jgi:hypothetical protein